MPYEVAAELAAVWVAKFDENTTFFANGEAATAEPPGVHPRRLWLFPHRPRGGRAHSIVRQGRSLLVRGKLVGAELFRPERPAGTGRKSQGKKASVFEAPTDLK
jgi:hypothetical protein